LAGFADLGMPAGDDEPAPGIVVPCGHSEVGKACETYSRLSHGLASKGYVVLIYDPIGQGERRMYTGDGASDGPGTSLVGGCTSQHTHLGVQLASVGLSLARYMIFDTMRAIDLLLSRPEVDARRIGCTGCSGGGTNTAYTMALDERIAAAMPVCYITTHEARQLSEQIADYEKNLYAQTERGLDEQDYVALVAPRPVCIGAATEDFFPLWGARVCYESARRVYEVLGVPERCEMVEVEGKHGYSEGLRQAAYDFFNRWFGVEADAEEPDVELPDEEDLWCFPAGVGAEGTYRVVLSQARAVAEEFRPQRVPRAELIEELTSLVRHVPELVESGPWQPGAEVSAAAEGWEVAEVQPPSAPPVLVARRPGERPLRVTLCASLDELAELDEKVGAAIVLPVTVEPDLQARAARLEAGERNWPWIHSRESFLAFYAEMLGWDWLYLRAHQVLGGLQALGEGQVSLHARGTLGLPALYAAVLDQRVVELTLEACLWSYASALATEVHVLAPADVPWTVLGSHDLPDLLAALAPRPLRVSAPVGADGRPLSSDQLQGLDTVVRAYAEAGAEDQLIVAASG
ncbi:MAG: acetylxylan esterase, partial [Armatimonadetes bacterium]|nr:acetylxylan esterase [Armatimonadota bacterium]